MYLYVKEDLQSDAHRAEGSEYADRGGGRVGIEGGGQNLLLEGASGIGRVTLRAERRAGRRTGVD